MKFLALTLCLLLLTGCGNSGTEEAVPSVTSAIPETTAVTLPPESAPPSTEPVDPVRMRLDSMTLEEKVGQLFLARCNAATAVQDIMDYHLGGLVLFGSDFENQTPDSLRQTLHSYQDAANIRLLIAVDEEGGTVTRISQFPAFRSNRFPSPRNAYAAGGLTGALEVEEEKCKLLQQLEVNVNLGPVCDITTKPGVFMYKRSLGQEADETSDFVRGTVGLMQAYEIGSVLKHFPGYGNNTDTHTGIAVDSRSLSELESRDLLPFTAGIEAGCGAVLVSHTIVEALDGELPASLSPAVHQYLREEMGFGGVIITDDLVMQAITDLYGAGEAAVLAVLAGNDLLCATDYRTQYEAVLGAVGDGRIDTAVIDSAVSRVLQWKMDLGLMG